MIKNLFPSMYVYFAKSAAGYWTFYVQFEFFQYFSHFFLFFFKPKYDRCTTNTQTIQYILEATRFTICQNESTRKSNEIFYDFDIVVMWRETINNAAKVTKTQNLCFSMIFIQFILNSVYKNFMFSARTFHSWSRYI